MIILGPKRCSVQAEAYLLLTLVLDLDFDVHLGNPSSDCVHVYTSVDISYSNLQWVVPFVGFGCT